MTRLNAKLHERQHSVAQITPQNFRLCLPLQLQLEVLLCIQPKTLARFRSSSTASSLVGRCLGDRTDQQVFYPDTVIKFLLREPGIDNVDDPIYRQGRLGDVGRHDHLPSWLTPSTSMRRVEYSFLLLRREVGVQWYASERSYGIWILVNESSASSLIFRLASSISSSPVRCRKMSPGSSARRGLPPPSSPNTAPARRRLRRGRCDLAP
jgi:hypothetical protein